ncbi:MAG: hypothetical protein ACJAYK_000655 [Crocinitomicaceae bacterium]|jgi:hypothetical protein
MVMNKLTHPIVVSMILSAGFLLGSAAQSDVLEETLKQESSNLSSAKKSQNKIDVIYDKKSEAIQELRITKSEIDQLGIYNRQLMAIISDQQVQKLSFEKQLKDIEVTQRGIMPLMERMLTMLDQFIELDLPFLLDERQERIATLRGLLLSSEVTISEKFRRVLEAYQIELEYGRTIEAYRAKSFDGIIVDYLRLGRVALYYVGLNSSDSFAWDQNSKSWVQLDGSFKAALDKGIQIARKQSAPSLLELQMPSLGEVK